MLRVLTAGVLTVSANNPFMLKMKVLENAPAALDDDFAGLLFEPSSADATKTCEERCPCLSPNASPSDACDCGAEMQCGGDIPIDLSAHDGVTFEFDTPAEKYVEIRGSGRTRIEFQATVDCPANAGEYLDIAGADITPVLTEVPGLDSAQKMTYNAAKSFVNIGKCAEGCGDCEIYTRIEYQPVDGALAMDFTKVTWSIDYDNTKVLQGNQTYTWGTWKYGWIRDSSNRRVHRRSLLEEDNTYMIKDLPEMQEAADEDDPQDSTNSTNSTSPTTCGEAFECGTKTRKSADTEGSTAEKCCEDATGGAMSLIPLLSLPLLSLAALL